MMITRFVLVLPFVWLAACGAAAPTPSTKPLPEAPPPPTVREEDRLVCPADVQACPGGAFVSRNPDKGCAFDACPGEKK